MPEVRTFFKADQPAHRKKSQRTAAEDRRYNQWVDRELAVRIVCQARLKGCGQRATEIHHVHGGIWRRAALMSRLHTLAVCRSCHRWIEEHPAQSYELGLKRRGRPT